MTDGVTKRRWLGIAACVAALLLLIAALVVGKTAYSPSLARLARDDTQRL